MRTDPRYTRVRSMLTCEEIPRMPNGGIALCHYDQRMIYFAGGFLQYLLRSLDWAIREARLKQAIAARKRS